ILTEDKMHHLLSEMGYFIGRHPKSILLTTFLATAPILSFFVWFPVIIEADMRRGFAHKNGASLREFERFANFFNVSMYDFEIFTALITSKEGHLVPLKLSAEVCDDVSRLDEYVRSFSVNSTEYGFIDLNEFRVKKSNRNHAFQAFKLAYGLQNALAPDFDKSIVLSYPNSLIYGYTLDLRGNIFAAEVNNQFQEQGLATAIESVHTIALFYFVNAPGYMGKKRLQQWEISLLEQSEQHNFSEYFNFYLYGDQSGVDDAFLLLHHWRKNAVIADPAERMRRVICEIGPSMTITSLTNALAFGVGAFSPTKIMSLFCVCTAMAMWLDYVFELSVFAPCLLLTSRWEKKTNEVEYRSEVHTLWWRYAKFVLSKWGRVCTLGIIVVLYVGTFFGLQKMETAFDESKTFPATSPLKYTLDVFDVIFEQCEKVSFVVNSPPNFTDPSHLANFIGMIESLEARPDANGRQGTQFWLFSYIEYCRNELGIEMSLNGTNGSISLDYLDEFANSYIVADQNIVHYHLDERGQAVVDSFILVLTFNGTAAWSQRAQFLSEIREFLLDYTEYNITLFNIDSTFLDIITTVKKEMAKTVLITLCCMAFVCFAFTPDILNTSIATLSILSISCTLLGMLSWWNLDMDPITMVNVLMAIGFSVDFSAHTCYHFHNYARSQRPVPPHVNPKLVKLADIFHAVGNPLMEAGASTVICMLPLFTIDSYVIQAFAKTVCLVGALGILHGLFILPSILSLELGCKLCKRSKRSDGTAVPSSEGIAKESVPMM
ncbi:Patched domain-containing protein 3, partial [Toxocara canis]